MKFHSQPAPHWLGADPVAVIMRRVLLALIPAVLVSAWFLGPGVILNVAFACGVCLTLETLTLWILRKPVRAFVTDGSALITAVIIGLAMPSLTPWWITATACLFAIVLAKHLYGGLGYNVFNPAMIGYVVVLVSFPAYIGNWPAENIPNWETALEVFLSGESLTAADALSGATPLDNIKIQLSDMLTIDEILAQSSASVTAWLWINLAALAGGIYLLATRVIRWQLPLGMLGALALLYTVFYLAEPALHPSPVFGLLSGGTMLAAFFVVTDPVSAPASDSGRLYFGAGCGLLCFALREWGAFPDGLAFAVVLMNMLAPLIDRYTIPRVLGHENRP